MADWVNDEVPYRFQTDAGSIIALPSTMELSDREMLALRKQPLKDVERSFVRPPDVLPTRRRTAVTAVS